MLTDVNGVWVRAHSLKILRALFLLNKPISAPELVLIFEGKHADISIRKTLNWLVDKNLATCTVVDVQLKSGKTVRRIYWQISENAEVYFEQNAEKSKPD